MSKNSLKCNMTEQVTINDFDKIALLGKGSCGKVYLVKHKKTNYPYAMKVLNKHKRKTLNHALTERKILMNMKYPFISSLYFCFQTELNLYIVMQFCAGGDFYSVIRRQPHKCLTESQTKYYSSCILLALEYLHFNGIIYRDLKPENILMHESGHIMLTDFDLSICSNKVIPRIVTKPYSRCSGVCMEPDIESDDWVGTPEYMAPEIVEGKHYNCCVDWWSFGILIFEMLYSESPFCGENLNKTFQLIQKCHLEFPSNHTPYDISSKVKNLIKHLLIHEPEKRLGFAGGSTEIKDHPFFKDVEFQLLRNETPPIIPELSGPLDTHYFDNVEHCDQIEDKSNVINPETLGDENIWKAFNNINRVDSNPCLIKN